MPNMRARSGPIALHLSKAQWFYHIANRVDLALSKIKWGRDLAVKYDFSRDCTDLLASKFLRQYAALTICFSAWCKNAPGRGGKKLEALPGNLARSKMARLGAVVQ